MRRRSPFWNRVIVPTRTKAAKAWRVERGATADAMTPFDNFKRRIYGAVPRPSCVSSGSLRSSRRRGWDTRMPGTCSSPCTPKTRRESLRAELQAIAAEGGIDARLASRRLT